MIKYIYCLKNPNTGVVFYVGQTKNLYNRLYQHFLASYEGQQAKDIVIRELKDEGISPIIEKLEEINVNTADDVKLMYERERYWIEYFNKINPLLNIEGNVRTEPLSNGLEGRICEYCGELFYPKKKKAKYCSATHRVYANREKNNSEIIEKIESEKLQVSNDVAAKVKENNKPKNREKIIKERDASAEKRKEQKPVTVAELFDAGNNIKEQITQLEKELAALGSGTAATIVRNSLRNKIRILNKQL